MAITDLHALARAFQSNDDQDPELLVLGQHLPESQYSHPAYWDGILNLGNYNGSNVKYYSPRAWDYYEGDERSDGVYKMKYTEERTVNNDKVDFTRTIPLGTIDRIIFLTPCNGGDPLPEGAEIFVDGEFHDKRRHPV